LEVIKIERGTYSEATYTDIRANEERTCGRGKSDISFNASPKYIVCRRVVKQEEKKDRKKKKRAAGERRM